MENLFIGVDGGGTKTEAVIQNAAGQTLGIGVGGPGNIRTSVPETWNSVRTAIDAAAASANINLKDYEVHVGMGMAGTELSTAARDFLNTPHSFKTLVLDSDAHAACLGVHAGKDGAIIIVGTGVIGYLINHNQTYRTGGYGFPHSDEGGGAWLGLELFRHTFKAIDQRILWTPMLKHLFAQFNDDAQAFYDYANTSKPSDYAKFAPMVFQFTDQDPLAKKLLITAAFEVDQIFAGLWQQSKVQDFPLALLGGIAPFIAPFTSKELQKNIVARKFDAPIGAIMLVKQYLGLI